MAAAVATETERFLTLARERLAAEGWSSLDWVETGLREALLKDGRRWLESLLNDPSLPVPEDASGAGEKSTSAVPRQVGTVLGEITLRRNYYHCAATHQGRYPLDQALRLVEGYSPTLARLMTRAAAQSGFAAASEDLRIYGGIDVGGRQIHRLLQTVGPRIRESVETVPAVKLSAPLPVLYVSVDGTGAPMVAAALAGRRGKQPDGSSKTREVKLGCVFTQHHRNEEGQPVRDPDATTYLCGLESAGDFGGRLRQEAIRRGLGQSQRAVLLGDGAAWVWELSRVNFSGVIEILDYYHGREHLSRLVHALDAEGTPAAARTMTRWESWLWEGQVERLMRAARKRAKAKCIDFKAAGIEIGYFEKNRRRMRYGQYRREGLFIGSGVVEAGCKTVIGQRAKQSGMRWTEAGLLHVLHTRCALLGGQFDWFWNRWNQSTETSNAFAA